MGMTYKDSGVDKEAGYKEVKLIKNFIKDTYIDGVISDIGGFAGLFQLSKDYKEPVLVSGTDGVGTKVMVAQMADLHQTIGEDCVAMCVNDILCQGAKPLFFLDYIATGKLLPEKVAHIVEGVANGCKKAGCALIGGETSEMPGIYQKNHYDLAGFCVGVAEKSKLLNGKESIEEGDVILGLTSSGIHSNGYSLVRNVVFEKQKFEVWDYIDELGTSLGEELLKPTKIYAKTVIPLIEKFNIKGLCHITGGGFYENVPRILKDGLCAEIEVDSFPHQKIFELLAKWGDIETDEMYSTFNMGIGMLVFVSADEVKAVIDEIKLTGEEVYEVGKVVKGSGVKLCRK